MAALFAAVLALLTGLSPLLQATSWLGARPTAQSLSGKVVIVDVFTFDCVNCRHVVPELRRLRAGLPATDFQIVGVHSPETPFERDRGNVVAALAEQGITWPVAVDNDFAIWHAYRMEYWPTQMIFDRSGRLRKTIIGEGQDSIVESTVRSLLAERAAERDFRVVVSSSPGSAVALRAIVPRGWIAAFCTPSLCSRGQVTVHVPKRGSALVALHLYPLDARAPTAFVPRVAAQNGNARIVSSQH
jgi:thiol-disulfide isomerase/thioredoxin